jgi:1,2-diacylglycerol 3-alpha-glucosyltransferase
MRVGLFTNNYLPFRGGVTTAVETLRQGLVAQGHQAWVFAPAWNGPHVDPDFVFRYPSVPAPTYPGFAVPLPFSRRWSRAALDLDLDIYHAQHPFLLGVTARRLARAQGRPLVFTYHTRYEKYAHYVPLPEPLVSRIAVRLACRFAGAADLVVAPSARIAESLEGQGVKAEIAVVPTGVPLDLFRPGDRAAARRRLGLAGDAPLCLYVGRLDREKSVERVIEAFGSIELAVSGAQLLLVGQGSHETTLRRLAASSPARPRIRFAGSVAREDLPPYYQAADLFLFSSETETQGLVLAEAHACGLPAVAVRASGVDEVVRDGETGLLTKADAGDLADAAIGLLLDSSRRSAMALASRALAESDFSAERQVEVMVARYQKLAGGQA